MNKKMNAEELITENRKYVEAVAKQYLNQGLTMEQLIDEGNNGLLKAAERYDERKGCKFISYAVWWIRQSILQALADKAEGVDSNQLTERERFILEHTDEEAAAHYEITTRRVQQIRERALQKQNPTNKKPNKMTNQEILQGLVIEGMNMRYGDKLKSVKISPAARRCSMIPLKMLWELKHIKDAGFVDYYLMMFWLFHQYAKSAGIGFWARGAMNSSIVCYCLGLTEVDPMKYGLHSARFVNDELPEFQFDVEASRFDEFMKEAEEMLQAHAKSLDVEAVKASLFKNLTPMEYLSRKNERQVPENIDDELARYALYFPRTMDLYEGYVRQSSTFDGIIYQEQMIDILRHTFHVGGIKANNIRLAIQRGETEQVETYKNELFANLQDITPNEAETAWQRLTSNPRAFLKAHAVSRVLAKYHYDF